MMVSLENVLKKNNLPNYSFAVEAFCCQCKKSTVNVVMTANSNHDELRRLYCKICGSGGGCFYNLENSFLFAKPIIGDNVYLVLKDEMYCLSIYNTIQEEIGSFSSIKEVNLAILNYFILS